MIIKAGILGFQGDGFQQKRLCDRVLLLAVSQAGSGYMEIQGIGIGLKALGQYGHGFFRFLFLGQDGGGHEIGGGFAGVQPAHFGQHLQGFLGLCLGRG